jgi:hypothetical protein
MMDSCLRRGDNFNGFGAFSAACYSRFSISSPIFCLPLFFLPNILQNPNTEDRNTIEGNQKA